MGKKEALLLLLLLLQLLGFAPSCGRAGTADTPGVSVLIPTERVVIKSDV